MIAGTRLVGLVLVWLLVMPIVATAQERRELTLGSGEAPVTVFADRLESLERENLVIAEGHVELEQGEVRLEADRVELNTETGEAVAVGRVVFFDGRDRLAGERLEYSFRTGTGIIYRAEGFAEPHFFFSGERMERFGEKAYRLTGGTFTTCEGDEPAWQVRLGKANAYLDDWIWGTNASFWVGRVPLIPFIPVFAASLRKDRHSGLLAPKIGYSNTKGAEYQQPIFWAISDSQDLTVVPGYFSKRGPSLGGDYRYIRTEGSRGELEGFFIDDSEKDEPRWVVGLRHEEQITPRLTLKADLARVSDIGYFSEFGDTLDERSRQRLESNLSLTQRWESWNLFGRLFAYQDLTTEEPIELQRLPELRLSAFPQQIGLGDLLFELESSYNNFVRDVGSDGQRLDIHPRFSYPYSLGGAVTLTPRLGGRETVYDTKVIGTKVDRGFLVENTTRETIDRSLFEAGLDVETRAYRVYDWGGLLGVQRVQHSIEPRVSYNYINDVNHDDIPQFDGTDLIRGSNGFTYSLINRIKARSTPSAEYPTGRVWELARLTFSQTYDLQSPPFVEPTTLINQPVPKPTTPPTPPIPPILPDLKRLSPLTADLILEPLYGLRFRGSASFDPYQRSVQSATTDISYETKDFLASFGTRHVDGGSLDFIQAELRARLTSKWAVRVLSNYEVATSTVVENRLEVSYRHQCWAITAAFIDRTNEDEIRLTISLLELGQYGFGQSVAPR